MKQARYIILAALMLLFLGGNSAVAQSSMTDEQVLEYATKKKEEGVEPRQILLDLQARGVTKAQLMRVRQMRSKEEKSGAVLIDDEAAGERIRKVQTQEDILLPVDDELLDEEEEDVNQKQIFGHNIFAGNKKLSFEPNLNIPTPQDYVLGPGDEVLIDIYGSSQSSFNKTISPDGVVSIPGYGPIQLSGLTVIRAEDRLRERLSQIFTDSEIMLTVGKTRSVVVNVMGEVMVPGTYTLPAFSSVFHSLYVAGGANEIGTLRSVKVYRQGKQISDIDVYSYILSGKTNGDIRLQDNDVVLVGTYDCLVNMKGRVKRPMYYEMKKSENLWDLLQYSGGFAGDAYTQRVRVFRQTGHERSIYNIGEFDFASFQLHDGDVVEVDSVLDRYSNMVEVKGAVFRPGKYQVGGEIQTVRQLVEAADGVTEEAFTDRVIIHRTRLDRTLEVLSVDLSGVLQGRVPDIALQKEDVIFVPTRSDVLDERVVEVFGEVHSPGSYKWATNATLEDIILQAGGLKETASTVKVDVSRRIINPKAMSTDSVLSRTYSFALKEGFVIDGEPGFKLQPYDRVYVRQSPVSMKQQNVSIEGEVIFQGFYPIQTRGMRLSELVKMAGGCTGEAYMRGAKLIRKATPDEYERMKKVYKRAIEEWKNTISEQLDEENDKDRIERAEHEEQYELEDTYTVSIHLDKALKNPGSNDDIMLREYDRLIVPVYTATVTVNGEVMSPNTLVFESGKKMKYYVNQAGGYTPRAKKGYTYITYMNGTVTRAKRATLEPGCEIMVPSKILKKRSLAEWLPLATTTTSLATMAATLANILKK